MEPALNTRLLIKRLLSLFVLLPALAFGQAVTATSSNGMAYSGPGWTNLPNFATTSLFTSNVGTGDVDLYTVPSGKRAMVYGIAWNSTASSISFYSEIKISGTYYAIVANQTLASTSTAPLGVFAQIILEAGQKFSIHTTGTGLNIMGAVYTFDAIATAPKTVLITSFINGDNTVYACSPSPPQTACYGFGRIAALISGAATQSILSGYNNTGGSLTYHWNFVPNGGSAGTSNQISQAITAAAGAGTPAAFTASGDFAMGNGDKISVAATSTNANQIAWVNVVEQ
jgi:hypothetical protein